MPFFPAFWPRGWLCGGNDAADGNRNDEETTSQELSGVWDGDQLVQPFFATAGIAGIRSRDWPADSTSHHSAASARCLRDLSRLSHRELCGTTESEIALTTHERDF